MHDTYLDRIVAEVEKMILVLDLGNTNLYMGVFDQFGTLLKEYRKHTDLNKSSDEYKEILQNFLLQDKIDLSDFEGAILSSVIPSLTRVIKSAVEKLIGKKCLIVGREIKSGLPIRIDNPTELGADLVCDAVGAIKKYGAPVIVADLGTATKMIVVDASGACIGCTISPGMKISMVALVGGTAQLTDISFIAPKSVIGKNTSDSLNSGSIYGTCAMIEGLAKRIENELGYDCKKVLTGGYSNLIYEYIDNKFNFDPSLILEGLYQIYKKNA